MKTTYAFHNRTTGPIELCDGEGHPIHSISADALIPDMVEVNQSNDPTDTAMQPFSSLCQDVQDSILHDYLEVYCEAQGMKLVELNHD